MKRTLFFSLVMGAAMAHAQNTATFEVNAMPLDTFLNGQDSIGYSSGGVYFHCQYDTSFGGYWADGFAISTMRDSADGTFNNLYSSRAATGHQSDGYAVVSAVDTTEAKFKGNLIPEGGIRWLKMYINNTTFAYDVMENGNALGKKFGGADGTDPDYFFVRIRSSSGDSIDVYLADFRSADSTQDYIISEWTEVDLSALHGERLSFQLYSSDIGGFGINTPGFFCIDDLQYDILQSVDEVEAPSFSNVIYAQEGPDLIVDGKAEVAVYQLSGQLVSTRRFENKLPLSSLTKASGIYFIQVSKGEMREVHKVWLP